MAKKKWIAGATKNARGQFRAKAKRAGMSTQAYARRVKANPGRYDPRTRRQATLALNLMKASKGSRKRR